MLHNQGDFGEGVEKNAMFEFHKHEVELKKPDPILQSSRTDKSKKVVVSEVRIMAVCDCTHWRGTGGVCG